MGWGFRKSFKAGPVRINFSQRGVGYSFGFGGVRYTQRAGGLRRALLAAAREEERQRSTRRQAESPSYKTLAKVVVGFFVLGFYRILTEGLGPTGIPLALLLTAVTIVGLLFAARALRIALEERALLQRRTQLIHRFGEAAAIRILSGSLWRGASEAMVVEMLEAPSDVKRWMRYGRTGAVWTYGDVLDGNYVRIQFEEGTCVAWESQSNRNWGSL